MRKKKLKIDTRDKCYPLDQSPIYCLRSKAKLAKLMKFKLSELYDMCEDSHYSIFNTLTKNSKSRTIEHPRGSLEVLHTRLASLLTRVETHSFVHSGKKKHSNITNANCHRNSDPMLVTDIKAFFQSTTKSMIFSFFYSVLKCSSDVADILSSLCTVNGHLPTGSRISMPLAYWANIRMFDELKKLVDKHNIKMTLYVDDLTFSGSSVNPLLRKVVNDVISRHGHLMHPTKTKLYLGNQYKLVTGVVVKDQSIQVRKSQLHSLSSNFEVWNLYKTNEGAKSSSITRTLVGRLQSMSSIDSRYKDKIRTVMSQTAK